MEDGFDRDSVRGWGGRVVEAEEARVLVGQDEDEVVRGRDKAAISKGLRVWLVARRETAN